MGEGLSFPLRHVLRAQLHSPGTRGVPERLVSRPA
jgi:hypothetical protein